MPIQSGVSFFNWKENEAWFKMLKSVATICFGALYADKLKNKTQPVEFRCIRVHLCAI